MEEPCLHTYWALFIPLSCSVLTGDHNILFQFLKCAKLLSGSKLLPNFVPPPKVPFSQPNFTSPCIHFSKFSTNANLSWKPSLTTQIIILLTLLIVDPLIYCYHLGGNWKYEFIALGRNPGFEYKSGVISINLKPGG